MEQKSISKEEMLEAIAFDQEEEWEEALRIMQHYDSQISCWFRAYLYRKAGDEWNANYWYDKAGRKYTRKSFEAELEEIIEFVENSM